MPEATTSPAEMLASAQRVIDQHICNDYGDGKPPQWCGICHDSNATGLPWPCEAVVQARNVLALLGPA